MSELAALQELFGAAMTDRARDEHALPLIAGNEVEARQRLAIYRANVAANAAGALAAIYPIVRKLVGDEFFAGLAQAYCAAHPSVSGDLNEQGEQLADFLPAFAPAQSLPYLPDVARLEWLAHKAHYAADHASLDVGTLNTFSERDFTQIKLMLHPAVAVLGSAYPLFRIWEVHQEDYQGEIAVDLASGDEQIVVYRPQFRVAVAKLSTAEAQFLNAVARGDLLGTALQAAFGMCPQFDLGESLKNWVTSNIVVKVYAAGVK